MVLKRKLSEYAFEDTGLQTDDDSKKVRRTEYGDVIDILPISIGGIRSPGPVHYKKPPVLSTRKHTPFEKGIDAILGEQSFLTSDDDDDDDEIGTDYHAESTRSHKRRQGFDLLAGVSSFKRSCLNDSKDSVSGDKENDDDNNNNNDEDDNKNPSKNVTFRKPRLANYNSLYDRYRVIKKREYKKRKAKWSIPRKHEYYKKTFSRGIESSGDKRIKALREALLQLDELGYRRSSHQREFHEAFIGACLPQIYGEDFDRNLVKILRENSLDEIRCEIMVCCPRRFGKTIAVALFAAAYMWTQPEAEIIIYSIAKRTSTMMSSKIYNMVLKLAGGDHCINTHNQEDLVITNMHGGESVLHSYPAASKISIFFFIVVVVVIVFLLCVYVYIICTKNKKLE